MQPLFSIDDFPVHRRFQAWMDIWSDRFGSINVRQVGNGPFHAHISGMDVGSLRISMSNYSGQIQTAHRSSSHDTLVFLMRLSGSAANHHYDRAAVQGPGDILILDRNRPLVSNASSDTKTLVIELPRKRIENMLGPAALFAGVTVGADLPGSSLVRAYINELIRLGDQLSSKSADMAAQIGTDLIVASIAERMEQDTPKSLQATVTTQRAKAFIEANSGDPTLDPPQVALALGISLRHLQQLFQAQGQQVADWIWQRRLETAAQRLGDPGQAHMPLGVLAYNCGFVSQAHFSRRFKEAFGMSPGDYRRSCMMPKIDAASS